MKHTRRALLTALVPAMATAQTLAHPGWRGNGIAAERWWQQAAVVQLQPDTTFVQAAAALDKVSEAGADTVLLPDLEPEPGGAAPFADRFGTMDDLDSLLREASSRRMHVLLTAPLLRLANSSGEQRFWLARGVAGFSVGPLRPAEVDTLEVLRTALDRYPGQRLVLTSLDTASDETFAKRFARAFHPPTLRLLTPEEAAGRPAPGTAAVLVTDPVNAPPLHGLLPMLPLAALQSDAGIAATRQLLARNRTLARHR